MVMVMVGVGGQGPRSCGPRAHLQAGKIDIRPRREGGITLLATEAVVVVEPLDQPAIVPLVHRRHRDRAHSDPVNQEEDEPHDVVTMARGLGSPAEGVALDERLGGALKKRAVRVRRAVALVHRRPSQPSL